MEIKEWYSLKAGDVIYSGKDSRPRLVTRGCSDSGFVEVEARKLGWNGKSTTLFCVGERKQFSLTPQIKNLAVHDLIQQVKNVPDDKRMRIITGIEDEAGNPTKDGLALLMNILYQENLEKINQMLGIKAKKKK